MMGFIEKCVSEIKAHEEAIEKLKNDIATIQNACKHEKKKVVCISYIGGADQYQCETCGKHFYR